MEWMLHTEEKGLGQDYVPPDNANVDGISSAFVVDVYGMHIYDYPTTHKLTTCR